MNLYELTGQYLELLQMAEDGDLDPEVLKDTMEAMDGELEEKVDGYGMVIRDLQESMKALKSEIDRLTQRYKSLDGNVSAMLKNVESMMIATDKPKIKTKLFTYYIQKNPPSVNVLDEKKIPDCFKIPQEPKLDKKAMLNFLKEANKPVEWGEIKQTESIRMR